MFLERLGTDKLIGQSFLLSFWAAPANAGVPSLVSLKASGFQRGNQSDYRPRLVSFSYVDGAHAPVAARISRL